MNFQMFGTENNSGLWPVGRNFSGSFFIFLGAIFLMNMFDITILGFSPWVLMALLPFYWSGALAYQQYKAAGRITIYVFLPLVFAIIPFGFALISMLGLNLGQYWPVFLILFGLYYLISGRK